jgi:hypothetical protein
MRNFELGATAAPLLAEDAEIICDKKSSKNAQVS